MNPVRLSAGLLKSLAAALTALAFTALIPEFALAATIPEDRKVSIGIISGYADPNGSVYDGTVGYGVEADFKPHRHIGLGVEASGFASDSGATSGDPTLTRSKVLAKGAFVAGALYAGAGVGPVWDHVSFQGTDSEIGYGPVAGFDIPIGQDETKFTVGANANYLFVGGGHLDSFGVNGALKYWF